MKRFARTVLLCLAAALILLPGAALAEGITIEIGGLTLGDGYYVNGANGAVGEVLSEAPASWNAHYNSTDQVLTLNGLTLTGYSAGSALRVSGSGSLGVCLLGTNTIIQTPATTGALSAAAYFFGVDVTVQGAGSLNVTVAKGDTVPSESWALHVIGKSLTVADGTLIAVNETENKQSAYGLYVGNSSASDGNLTVSGGNLTAQSKGSSAGAYICGALDLDGGNLTCRSAKGNGIMLLGNQKTHRLYNADTPTVFLAAGGSGALYADSSSTVQYPNPGYIVASEWAGGEAWTTFDTAINPANMGDYRYLRVEKGITGTVTLSGTPAYDSLLTAEVSNFTGTPVYQWMRGADPISGATQAAYTPCADDAGCTVACVVRREGAPSDGAIYAYVGPLSKNEGPAAPEGLTTKAPSSEGASDGQILGTTEAMQYIPIQNVSSDEWSACKEGITPNMRTGTYYVRYKETATHEAGAYATVIVNVGDIFEVALDPAGNYAFGAAKVGDTVPPRQVTVTNTGNQFTGPLAVTLSGDGASGFAADPASLSSLGVTDADKSAVFKVSPATNFAPGNYTATVTVGPAADNPNALEPVFFQVSFSANAADATPAAPPANPRWVGKTAAWNPAEYAGGYRLQPYKDEDELGDEIVLGSDVTSHDFSGRFTDAGPYRFKVLTVGDRTHTSDGVEWATSGDLTCVSVTFVTNGGTPVPSAQFIAQGSLAAKPADPQKGGDSFMGWYADKALTTRWDFADPIQKDTVLYARWASFQALLDGAGNALTLTEDYVLGADAFVRRTLALNLNGHTVDCRGYSLKVTGGVLTLKDDAQTPGVITGSGTRGTIALSGSGGVVVAQGGTAETTGKKGVAIHADGSGTVAVDGGAVRALSAGGYGVYRQGTGGVRVTGGEISLGLDAQSGGSGDAALFTKSTGPVTVSGGTVQALGPGTRAIRIAENASGGAVVVEGASTVVSAKATTATACAIENQGGKTVTVRGGLVEGSGTAIRNVGAGALEVAGGTVRGTYAGIEAYGTGAVAVRAGAVEATGGYGWGIGHSGTGALTVWGGTVTASGNSGCGISHDGAGEVLIPGGSVTGFVNGISIPATAAGAVKVSGGDVTGTNGQGIDNESACAVFLSRGAVTGGESGILTRGAGDVSVSGGVAKASKDGFFGIYSTGTGGISVSGSGRAEASGACCGAIRSEGAGDVTVSGSGRAEASGASCCAIYSKGAGTVAVSEKGSAIASGAEANAIVNETGGVVTVTGGTVSSTGDEGKAIVNTGGPTTVTGGLVKAEGKRVAAIEQGGHLLKVSGDARVEAVETANQGSYGILFDGNAEIEGGEVYARGTRCTAIQGSSADCALSLSGGTVRVEGDYAISAVKTVTVSGTGAVVAETGNGINLDAADGTVTVRAGGSVTARASVGTAISSKGTVAVEGGTVSARSVAITLGAATGRAYITGGTVKATGADGVAINTTNAQNAVSIEGSPALTGLVEVYTALPGGAYAGEGQIRIRRSLRSGDALADGTLIVTGSTDTARWALANIAGQGMRYALVAVGGDLAAKALTARSAPGNPVWDAASPGKAAWDEAENDKGYALQLYKDGGVLGAPILVQETALDLREKIAAAGKGDYTFTVTALGDSEAFADSDPSARSAAYNYVPPSPPAPVDPPAPAEPERPFVTHDDGTTEQFDTVQDALDDALPGESVTLPEDAQVSGDLTVPQGVSLQGSGAIRTAPDNAGNLRIGGGGKIVTAPNSDIRIRPQDQIGAQTGSGDAFFAGLTVEGALENGGKITLSDTKAEGDGVIHVTGSGELVLSGESAFGKVKLDAGRTVTLGANFTASGVAGTVLLGGDYKLGRQVLTLNGDTGKYAKCFKLGDAPDGSWYIGKDGCLARKAAAETLLLDALKLGKGEKIAAKNLLPLTFTGGATWISDNPAVLKVVGKGKKTNLKAVKLGSANLTAAFADGVTQAIPVTVIPKKDAANKLTAKDTITLRIGESKAVKAKIKPAAALDKTLNWFTTDAGVAAVDQTGTVTAAKKGKCKVYALSTAGARAVIAVTVKAGTRVKVIGAITEAE